MVKFLKEYQTLCQKYKMGLEGCGCCGSPFIEIDNECLHHIDYDYKTDKVKLYDDNERKEVELDTYIENFLENHKEYKDEQEMDNYLEGMLKNE